ncbi:oligosaccharide flippase family protein [Paucibacter sp. APW11]|uniref:Oligosaccharide flippase family protein n=1 Tax=Roseateles aquae TaxID=3077235 RepID=A0ABU3PGG8_9BURK|nr:oligosaccharide flippase family protein [Paucibacter sp. APW11]MDT9001237.1 oligosaccharide flippase family protein [Paucibacter sp. APW11]
MALSARLAPVAKLASASALAQLLPMLAAPLLTRFYGATLLGQWALFAAVAANLAVIACARYEYAIVLPRREAEAGLLLRLCLAITAALSLACLLAVLLALPWAERLPAVQALGAWWLALPLMLAASGLMQALTLWNNRQRRFGAIAQARVLQQGLMTLLQVLGIALGQAAAMAVLMLAQLLGAVAAPARLLWGQAAPRRAQQRQRSWSARWRSWRRLALRYRQFPLINSPHAFVNALQETAVIALIASLAGAATAGHYAIMLRLVKAPASLVGGALSEVLLGELAAGWQRREDLRPRLRKAIRLLALVALLPAALLLLFAPPLFGWALGSDWQVAGDYARWLTPYVFFHFIVAPLTVTTMVTGRQAPALLFSLVGNLVYVLALALGLKLGGDLRSALGAISLAMPVYFVAYLAWLVHGSDNRPRERVQ